MIIPRKINLDYLIGFKRIIEKVSGRFVIVCGGGLVARQYINALRHSGKSLYLQSLIGIGVTRLNARFMTYLFGKEASEGIPMDMKHAASLLRRNKAVFCGALRFAPRETSDATAAKLAKYLGSDLINITNVKGLYSSDPKKNKNAKLIRMISWKDFIKMTPRKYMAGQHFVLDQHAALIIKKHRIATYIIGPDLRNLNNLLRGKDFTGTRIEG